MSALLKLSADDATPANGCADCSPGPDSLSGFGRLDVGAALDALQSPAPDADRFEPNDDAGREAAIVYRQHVGDRRRSTGGTTRTTSTGSTSCAASGCRCSSPRGPKVDPSIVLWKPGLHALADARSDLRAKRSVHPAGAPERIHFRAHRTAWYTLQVRLARPGLPSGPYRIHLAF